MESTTEIHGLISFIEMNFRFRTSRAKFNVKETISSPRKDPVLNFTALSQKDFGMIQRV